jgi:hypothetical protein
MPVRTPTAPDEFVRYISASTSIRAEQAIAALDAANPSGPPPGSERRREPREPYHGHVSVKLAIRTTSIVAAGAPRTVCVEVFARNLSNSGFGFLAPAIYLPESGTGSGIALRGDDIFQVGKQIEIAIVRPEGRPRWMPGHVLRARVLPDGFVECGVEFI